MVYSDDIIEEVRGRSDIVDVISGYVRLTRKGSSYFGLCPFHNEKSPSFSVSGSKQMFYCFGCGEGGNVFSFIMKYENYTFPEAVKLLADRAGVQLPEVSMTSDERRQQDMKAQLYDINKEAALFYYKLLKSPGGQRAYDYFKNKRVLSDETIVHFGLDRIIDGRPLYEWVGEKVAEWGAECMGDGYSYVGAVVGATYPEMGRTLRKLMPKSFILVPGYGAQGGKGADLVDFFNEDGLGAIVNSSRGIIAAYKNEKYTQYGAENFGDASRAAVMDMVADINGALANK